MNLVQIPAQYAATVLDFTLLKRPKQFCESYYDNPERYIHPYVFLATNVSLTVLLYTWSATTHATRAMDTFSHSEATVLFAATAILHCVVAIVLGHLAAFLLNERVQTTDLFVAFCYTSVFYPLIGLLMALIIKPDGDAPRTSVVLSVTAIQFVAATYLLLSMSHFSALHGRRLLAFVSIAGGAMLYTMTIAGVAFAVVTDDYQQVRFSQCQVEDQWPLGTITIPVASHNPKVVVLMGASVGNRTGERFQFGSTRTMDHAIGASNGVGWVRNLEPNTTYYFRYVTTHGSGTCFGEVESFRTPKL